MVVLHVTVQKIKKLSIVIILLIGVNAYSADYTSSAHGDQNYGVVRNTYTSVFHTGNCKHCHDMHGSNGKDYALFYDDFISQTDNFCMKCHDCTTSVSSRAICNENYSYRAGGYTGTTSSVYNQFDLTTQTSAHDLDKILTFIQTQSWNFNSQSSPCVSCHNPHYAQGDPFNAPTSSKSSSTRGNLLTRPSKHGSINNSDKLWGDETGEKMSDFASGYTYQAPYRYNSTSSYEPDGSTTTNGANLTDMDTFCQDCHQSNMQSTPYNLANTPIDWSSTGDKHGLAGADGGIDIKAPYSSSNYGNYVLSCTDCHEPHGSGNVFLIRKEVNGNALTSTISDLTGKNMGYLCMRCHKDDNVANGGTVNAWQYVHHQSSDHPYTQSRCGFCHGGPGTPIDCNQCHLHGKVDSRTGRKCF